MTALNIKGKEGIEGLLYGTQARTQWPLKGTDGFMRARSSGKTGAPFSHLPTGGRWEGGGAINSKLNGVL